MKIIPILMYHSLDVERFLNKMALPKELFERHIQILQDASFEIITLEQCVKSGGREGVLEKKVVITFDDGFIDNYEDALPILKKYQAPATFFVSVDKIGHKGYMAWDMVDEMDKTPGIEIGSHGMFHESHADVTLEKAKYSLVESKNILEGKLGHEIKSFSYPVGGFTSGVMKLAKETGYKYACAASKVGKRSLERDPYSLKRIKISSTSNNKLNFLFRLSSLYNTVRKP